MHFAFIKMKCKYLLLFLIAVDAAIAKYLIDVNDSISLQDCSIDSVRNIAELHSNPHEVIIHNCQLDELPNALFIRFAKLRILEITDSHLKTVSDFAFNGLPELHILNLSRNNLTLVKTWSNGNLEALHTMDLRRNSIAELHHNAFKRYPNLLKLNLAVNHITSIPDELFRSIPLLKYLNVGKNNLKSIDSHTFKHLHKLMHLELRHNQLEFIEAESFVGNTHMRVLHLQVLLTCYISVFFIYKSSFHSTGKSHNVL